MTTGKWRMGRRAWFLALLLGTAVMVPLGLAQPPPSFNTRKAEKQGNAQDREDIWVLDFTFKDPRQITVDIPGRGRQLVWYLWYQVSNPYDKPHTFIPDFELVTLDPPGVYHDQVLPKAQDVICSIEEPTIKPEDRPKLFKNSVTISSEPIPPSKGATVARKVTGVAIWDDTAKEPHLQDATRFSIFVAGLSNGWSMDDKNVIRRKTLQLNFRRLGDRYYQDSRDIRLVNVGEFPNTPPMQWLYRASTAALPSESKEGEAPKAKEGAAPMPKEGETPKPPAGNVPKESAAPKPGAAFSPSKADTMEFPLAPLRTTVR